MSSTASIDRVAGARHVAGAKTVWWRLLLRLTIGCQWHYLRDAPATHAWLILLRKYDAFTTDLAYETRPRSWLGPLGHPAARRVMAYPLHQAMRERLGIVAEELAGAVAARDGRARLLSAPCGLCRDLIEAAARLGDGGRGVTWHALDLDARGDVIPAARRRTSTAGLAVEFYREDLIDPSGPVERAGQQPYDIVNCIGLTTWLPLVEVERLATRLRGALRPGGRLVIDNWTRHEHSQAGEALEIAAIYHPPALFREALTTAGFEVERERRTANGACTVVVATARP